MDGAENKSQSKDDHVLDNAHDNALDDVLDDALDDAIDNAPKHARSIQPPTRLSIQPTETQHRSESADAIAPSTTTDGLVQHPLSEISSKSIQLPRHDSEPTSPTPRKSSQAPRPSRDFDQRRDGPYGRPSITMVRRRSSVNALPRVSQEVTRTESNQRDPTAPAVEALVGYHEEMRPAFEPEPPPLNYSLRDRKRSIIVFWTLILIDCIAAPIILYFCLWYLTSLSPNAVFSIVTAALGGVSIVEYFVRFWRLWKKESTCRVIGARRMYLDWFHWNFTLGWVIIMIELIVGTVPENPPIRLLGMPLASMLYAFGTELLIVDTLRFFHVPAPCRMSSIPKGAQLRPAIYSIIEDVVAVDGSGGTEYREALNRRYEASHIFRAMLRRLGVFWAVGAEGMAVVTTILVFTIGPEAAYVVGWSAPFVWAGIWTLATFAYVHAMLKTERQAWAEEVAEKQGTFALEDLSERGTAGSTGEKRDEDALAIPAAATPSGQDDTAAAAADTIPK